MSEDIRKMVRERYGRAAAQVIGGGKGSCCSPLPPAGPDAGGCCGASPPALDSITRDLYEPSSTGDLPQAAVAASLGCGNPTALAKLHPGDIVLDLGSGGGIDVLLSAKRVGPTGKAYGLDMTDEMLDLARRNQRDAGVENAEFLRGEIEAIPLPDSSVDVIISNCVINLSGDKRRVLKEAFRVLKPGGRFAVSDIVVRGEVPAAVRRSLELWAGCVAGALEENEFERLLAEVGFVDISIEPTRVYALDDAREMLAAAGIDVVAVGAELDGCFMAAFVRARRA